MVLNQSARSVHVPALSSGDRLTRSEFERRHEASPENFKAELIEGVVYVASPVRAFHGVPHADLVTWLGVYRTATPGVSVADNTTTRLDLDNEPQPDALLRLETGGTSTIPLSYPVTSSRMLPSSTSEIDFGHPSISGICLMFSIMILLVAVAVLTQAIHSQCKARFRGSFRVLGVYEYFFSSPHPSDTFEYLDRDTGFGL